MFQGGPFLTNSARSERGAIAKFHCSFDKSVVFSSEIMVSITLPKFNSSPLKSYLPNGKGSPSFPTIFSGVNSLLNFRGVSIVSNFYCVEVQFKDFKVILQLPTLDSALVDALECHGSHFFSALLCCSNGLSFLS